MLRLISSSSFCRCCATAGRVKRESNKMVAAVLIREDTEKKQKAESLKQKAFLSVRRTLFANDGSTKSKNAFYSDRRTRQKYNPTDEFEL